LVPDVFASSEQFDEWFNLDIEDNDEKNRLISQLHKILRPFMLRRLKKEVETSLPPKHETILFTGMSAVQKKLYKDILIRDIDALQGKSGNRTAILNIVMQLRKCAGHPYLFSVSTTGCILSDISKGDCSHFASTASLNSLSI
jgi:SWI/SNF-related matrix-associated actin-dependent regulator of chromatin subfamily A member 5